MAVRSLTKLCLSGETATFYGAWGNPEYQVPTIADWVFDRKHRGQALTVESWQAWAAESGGLPVASERFDGPDPGEVEHVYIVSEGDGGRFRFQLLSREWDGGWETVFESDAVADLLGWAVHYVARLRRNIRQFRKDSGVGPEAEASAALPALSTLDRRMGVLRCRAQAARSETFGIAGDGGEFAVKPHLGMGAMLSDRSASASASASASHGVRLAVAGQNVSVMAVPHTTLDAVTHYLNGVDTWIGGSRDVESHHYDAGTGRLRVVMKSGDCWDYIVEDAPSGPTAEDFVDAAHRWCNSSERGEGWDSRPACELYVGALWEVRFDVVDARTVRAHSPGWRGNDLAVDALRAAVRELWGEEEAGRPNVDSCDGSPTSAQVAW